jgi:hypothetical protein
MRDARDEGAWAAFLFAPSRSLYTQLGFVPVGQERITCPKVPAVSSDAARPVHRGGPKDSSRLLPLLESHPVGVSRSLEDFETLLRVPDTHLYLIEGSERVLAYCIEGRGRDLKGVIHEWAGDPAEVAHLLQTVAAGSDAPWWVLSPESLPAPLEGTHHLGPMAQARILRPEELATEDPVEAFGNAETRGRYPIYVWGLDSF